MTNLESQSPWNPLKPLYVLPQDFTAIAHHRNYSNLRLDTLPEQAIGGLDKAEVIFLLLNPGFDDKDITVNLALPNFVEANRRNLIDPFGSPFYYFGGDLEQTGGYEWWTRVLKSLFQENISEEMMRDKIMAIEYFPYHSKNYKELPIVPSQQFAFELVREAINRQKTIVIMRGKGYWFNSVPELEAYENVIVHPNPRNVAISPKNIGELNFDRIRRLIFEDGKSYLRLYIKRFDSVDAFLSWLDSPETDIVNGKSEELKLKHSFRSAGIAITRRNVKGDTLAARNKAMEDVGYEERIKMIYEELHG